MGVGVVYPVAATAASTLSDKPRLEKDIEPLVDTAAWNLRTSCRAQPRNGMQRCTGFFGYADRRLNQSIAFRYRAASRRNIGRSLPKSMERGVKALKKLNVFAKMPAISAVSRPRLGISHGDTHAPAGCHESFAFGGLQPDLSGRSLRPKFHVLNPWDRIVDYGTGRRARRGRTG